jgi:membrane-bound lytic murein transglycosylase D
MPALLLIPFSENLAQVSECEQSPIACMLDSLLSNYHFKVKNRMNNRNQVKNVYGYAEGEIPVAEPQVVKDRMRRLGYEIPLNYNPQVQAFIDMYTLRRRDQVEKVLGLMPVYFPIFEEVFDKAGIPMEIKYLSIVESALNPHAISRVGATGAWQFMYYTARLYNLNIDTYVDERRDPYKSAVAAAEYFKNMYRIYKDWHLVIAAYNCGPGNVNKAIRRSGGKTNFWEISPYLPAETRGYVPAFMAACYVFNYPAEHNLYPQQIEFTYHQDTMHVVQCKLNLKELAETTGVEYEMLKNLNPELKTDFVPYSEKGYVLRVPVKVSQIAASNPESVFKPSTVSIETPSIASNSTDASDSRQLVSGKGNVVYHTVRSGDVVGNIAKKYGVTPSQIAQWNGLYKYRIKPGQKLKIYPRTQYKG